MTTPNRTLVMSDGGLSALVAMAVAVERRGSAVGRGRVVVVPITRDDDPVLIAAVERQAAIIGSTVLRPIATGAQGFEHELRSLVEASLIAVGEGFDVLVNPVNAGDDPDRIARVFDMGLRVAPLVSLGGRQIQIETPYADLTDRQIADLALDMDLPVWLSHWSSPTERERWAALLKEVGWIGDPMRGDAAVETSLRQSRPRSTP